MMLNLPFRQCSMLILAAFMLFLPSSYSAGRMVPTESAPALQSIAAPGDLILRAGVGHQALAVQAVSNAAMSHVGVIVRSPGGQLMVVHAAPPDPANGDIGGVRQEPLSRFISADVASAYRLITPADRMRMHAGEVARAAMALATQHIAFDDAFSLRDVGRFYCSELVAVVYRRGLGQSLAHVAQTDVPFFDEPIIMPDAFEASGQFRLVSAGTINRPN